MNELARLTTLDELAAAFRLQRQKLGLSQLALDDLAGLADGHVAKIEAQVTAGSVYRSKKRLGKDTIPKLLDALGLELVVVPRMLQPQEHRSLRVETSTCDLDAKKYWQRRTLKARTLAAQIPAEQRRERARKAANARWGKGTT